MIAKVNDLKILVIGNGFMLGGLFKFVLSLNSDQWLDWVFQTGCFAPGSTRNDWGTSRPCLFPLLAVKSKPPAVRVVVDFE